MQHALGRRIISGEMHYPRVPPEYWRDRLRMAAAMGLDAVSTYVFWNMHEPRPGEYGFDGPVDVRAYLRAASEEGLHVILRPGPYVCAEWDFGGLPAWLLADDTMRVRTSDAQFMQPVRRWLQRLGTELAEPLRDGTIIAVQLENEYGAFDYDASYMPALLEAYRDAGFDHQLFTIDQPHDLRAGAFDGLPCGVTFPAGGVRDGFAALREIRPDQAPFCAEFWAGWFDHWGEPHARTDGEAEAHDLDRMLSENASVNFYMFCGGTNFGFLNGANYTDDAPYQPDATSYDYLAAVDEAGRPRAKYDRFREIIARHRGTVLPEVPQATQTIAIPDFTLDESASAYDLLGAPVRSERPLPMEKLHQNFGYVVYRTQLHAPVDGIIDIEDVRDYAVVIVDGNVAGQLDRRTGETALHVRALTERPVLEIVVENTGRMNYGRRFGTDRKGVCGAVRLAGREVTNWECYALPMDDLSSLRFSRGKPGPLAFLRGVFELEDAGDTFLDVGAMGKGTVWINGHHLGRFWRIGPQRTLYVPGVWLRHGSNQVIAFDFDPPQTPVLRGLKEPVF